MTANEFTEWVDSVFNEHGWSKRECARQLGCGVNQILRWSRNGAPRYIGLACFALAIEPDINLPPLTAPKSRLIPEA